MYEPVVLPGDITWCGYQPRSEVSHKCKKITATWLQPSGHCAGLPSLTLLEEGFIIKNIELPMIQHVRMNYAVKSQTLNEITEEGKAKEGDDKMTLRK